MPDMHAVLTAGRAPYRLGLRRSWRERVVSYGLLAPATVLFAIFMFYPLLYTLYLSFFDWNMTRPTKEFVGLDNYISVFTDPAFGKIMGKRGCIFCCCWYLTLPHRMCFPLSCPLW